MGQLTFQATLGGAINLAGPNIATTTTFTLPAADGTNGQALTTNGSGTLAFATVGASAATPTALGTVYGKTDSSNTFLGYQVGIGSSTNNTALGYQAYYNLGTSNGNNTAVGSLAGYSVTSGGVDAFGWKAGYSTTTGGLNAAFGPQSLQDNTTGSSNCAFGYNALQSNTTASQSTAIGYQSLYSNITGSNSTAVGYQALKNSTDGNNTAVGFQAGTAISTGVQNTSIGRYSGASNNASTGIANTSVGNYAGYAFTSGGYNTAIGAESLTSDTTGVNNVSVGYISGTAVTTGSNNVFAGKAAGQAVTTGGSNVFIGSGIASTVTTGNSNVYIGVPDASGSAPSYEIAIGSGTGKGSTTAFLNPGNGNVYNGANTTTWSTTSDQRLKKNIVDNTVGLNAINSIRVRNFEYRLPDEVDAELKPTDAIKKSGVQLGVIAQELKAVLPECVKTETTGVMSVDADNLTWYMINAIKELKAENDSLKARLDAANL